jgi:hypothetical protein
MPGDPQDLFRPVFIVGVPRTGTTLLYRILDRHSAFCRHDARARENEPLVESHFARRFIRPAVDLWCADEVTQSLRSWFAHDGAAYSSFLLDCFRAFHVRAAGARACRRVLEKTPAHVMICDFMLAAFPQARVLCATRDPADVAASFRRRRALQGGPDGEWLDVALDLSRFVEFWNERAAAWVEFKSRFADAGRVVEYARLTSEPGAVLQEVLSFVGEEMEPHLLAGPRPREMPDWLDRYDSHVPALNSEVWRRYLSEDEALRLRTSCVPFAGEPRDWRDRADGAVAGSAGP